MLKLFILMIRAEGIRLTIYIRFICIFITFQIVSPEYEWQGQLALRLN